MAQNYNNLINFAIFSQNILRKIENLSIFAASKFQSGTDAATSQWHFLYQYIMNKWYLL